MDRKDSFTARQLGVFLFLALLSPAVRLLPRAAIPAAGHAAWLTPLPAALFVLALYPLLGLWLRRTPPGRGLAQAALHALGGVAGRLFLAVSAAWLTVYAGIVTRAAAERLLSGVFGAGPLWLFAAVLAAASAAAAAAGLRTLVRAAELFLPAAALLLLLVGVFSLDGLRADFLLPVSGADLVPVLRGSAVPLSIAALPVWSLFLVGHLRDPENAVREARHWTLYSLLAALLEMVLILGTLSPELALRLENAALAVVRDLTLFGADARVEALILSVWITTDLFFLAALQTAAGEVLRAVFSAPARRPFSLGAAAVSAVLAVFLTGTAFDLSSLTSRLAPAVNLVFTLGLIPAVLAADALRKP